MSGEKALFLDRDGVVNVEVGYLHRAEDVRFMPGIFSLCRTAIRLGYRLVVVTNQAGIARGLYTEADFETLMAWMREQLKAEGVELDAVYYCPYHPEHGVGEYKREHEDRKPRSGMLRRAEREFGVSLVDSVMVGDRCSDIAARIALGSNRSFWSPGPSRQAAGAIIERFRGWLKWNCGSSTRLWERVSDSYPKYLSPESHFGNPGKMSDHLDSSGNNPLFLIKGDLRSGKGYLPRPCR